MAKQNPFKKAERAEQKIKLLLTGPSGTGKSLTAIQLACHMAIALGRSGSVAVADSEDATALLYSYDTVLGEPYMCCCEQCIKSGHPIPLEFDHVDMRDHSPDEYQGHMRSALENGYAVLVIDSASHEWCGVNGCLEQVDALKGDGKGRQTDNAWNIVTAKHNAFLSDIRSIPMNLIATARTKPGRGDDAGQEIIIQRDKDGPFEYEFQMWGTLSRNQPGTIHVKKSRSGHFEGVTWKRSGRFAAEQLLLWAGQLKQAPPKPTAAVSPPAAQKPDMKTCKHPSWSQASEAGEHGERVDGMECDRCGAFETEEAPPVETLKEATARHIREQGERAEAQDPTPDAGHREPGPTGGATPPGSEADPKPEPETRTPKGSCPHVNLKAIDGGKPGEMACEDCGEAVQLEERPLVEIVEAISADIDKLEAPMMKIAKGFLMKAGEDRDKLGKLADWVKQKMPKQ